jgi:low affinity Fe/Cu permease
MSGWFTRIASRAAHATGHYGAFMLALAVIVVWAVSGPFFGFSDTWQLVINTGTTIVTFLMVFLIQNSQNRDSRAMHLKLDELIRSIENASNTLIDAEEEDEEHLDQIRKLYSEISSEHEHAKDEAIVKELEEIRRETHTQNGAKNGSGHRSAI